MEDAALPPGSDLPQGPSVWGIWSLARAPWRCVSDTLHAFSFSSVILWFLCCSFESINSQFFSSVIICCWNKCEEASVLSRVQKGLDEGNKLRNFSLNVQVCLEENKFYLNNVSKVNIASTDIWNKTSSFTLSNFDH